MATAYLGLGSNLGNRLAFLRGGRDSLTSRFDITLRHSSGVYETAAAGGPANSPPYLNAVLQIETPLSPRELLTACLAVEDEFGRTRPRVWAPRTLDIDLLLYGEALVDESDLQIPHPRLPERAFVLVPLSEIAPDQVHPVQQQTIRAMAEALPSGSDLVPIRATW